MQLSFRFEAADWLMHTVFLESNGFAGLTPLVGLEWWGERNDV